MTRPRRGALATTAAAFAVASLWLAGTAEACGFWSLEDKEHGWLVVFRSIAIELVRGPAGPGLFEPPDPSSPASRPRTRRAPRRVLQLGKRWFEWRAVAGGGEHLLSTRGGAIRLDEKTVGRYSKTHISIGSTSFRVVIGKDRPAFRPGPYTAVVDGQERRVTVTRGGVTVLDGVGFAPGYACEQDPVLRAAAYLAWRELLWRSPRTNERLRRAGLRTLGWGGNGGTLLRVRLDGVGEELAGGWGYRKQFFLDF